MKFLPVTRLGLHFLVHFCKNTADFAQVFENVDKILIYFFRYNAENTDGRDFLYHDLNERRWIFRQGVIQLAAYIIADLQFFLHSITRGFYNFEMFF